MHRRRSGSLLEMPVKPSAQPTLVRTQHLPPVKSQVGACFCLAAAAGGERCVTPPAGPALPRFCRSAVRGAMVPGRRPVPRGEYAEKFLRSRGTPRGPGPACCNITTRGSELMATLAAGRLVTGTAGCAIAVRCVCRHIGETSWRPATLHRKPADFRQFPARPDLARTARMVVTDHCLLPGRPLCRPGPPLSVAVRHAEHHVAHQANGSR
jgi:hypothetical protein